MVIGGGDGVIHHQPVSALGEQPLHVELQLGPGVGLEVPQAGGPMCFRAAQSHGAAGHHLLVTVTV